MKVTIYTNYLVVTYDVIFNGTKEELAHALDEGPVLLSVANGGSVYINAIQSVAIEINDSPPK